MVTQHRHVERPPRVPAGAELEEAIQLLGALAQSGGQLRLSKKQRLVELIGLLPISAEQATAWKTHLKAARAAAT